MTALALQPGESAIFGYGSLLWQPSMERTAGRPYAGRPLIAHLPGWRRVWDVVMANRTFYFEDAGGARCVPEYIAYLNIRPVDVRPAETLLNGLVYAVTPEQLAAFDAREEPYDRLDISSQLTGVTVTGGPVFVYVGKPDRLRPGPEPKTRVAIRATYLDIIENGLTALGEEFRAAYDRSTDPPPQANVIADQRADSPPPSAR